MWRGCEDPYEDLKPVNSFVYTFFSLKKVRESMPPVK
jgi:hypothetical protein